MRRFIETLGFVIFLGSAHAVAQDTLSVEDQQAISKAAASIKWLDGYQCPTLGFPPAVKGLQTHEEVQRNLQSNWEFVTGRLQAIHVLLSKRDEVQRDLSKRRHSPGDKLIQQLNSIDANLRVTSARVSSSLVYWTLANWVELAGVNPEYRFPVSGEHPINPFLLRESQLRNFIRNFDGLPGGAEFLRPIEAKYRRCLLSAQNQILERNADSIYAALNTAKTSAEATSITRSYGVVEMSFSAEGIPIPEVIQAQQERVAILLAEEKRIEEERRRAEEKARFERQLVAEKQYAELRKRQEEEHRKARVEAERNLPTASALVSSLAGRSVSGALRYMHEDVSLVSPNGAYHGKGQVGSRLQQGFTSGKSGASFGPPYLDSNNQIVSTISSAQGSARMTFEFRGDLVSYMRIAR